MGTKKKQKASVQDIWAIQAALGGERRGWHPRFYMNDRAEEAVETLEKRPESVEEWGRPDMESMTHEIGDAVENYLEDNYWMEIVDDDAVDLVVTDGVFEGSPVQSKGAIILAKDRSAGDGTIYSRPGGFYMREDNMKELSEMDETALLHTSVHYPRREIPQDLDVPVLNVNDEIDTAIIGELTLPVEEVYRQTEFHSDGNYYWKWSKAYGKNPNSSEIVQEWYQNTEISERI